MDTDAMGAADGHLTVASVAASVVVQLQRILAAPAPWQLKSMLQEYIAEWLHSADGPLVDATRHYDDDTLQLIHTHLLHVLGRPCHTINHHDPAEARWQRVETQLRQDALRRALARVSTEAYALESRLSSPSPTSPSAEDLALASQNLHAQLHRLREQIQSWQMQDAAFVEDMNQRVRMLLMSHVSVGVRVGSAATVIVMLKSISGSEVAFIQEGIAQNVRMDGRGRLDYRPFSLETRLVAQANGSARLVLSDTDVLVGVKAELAEPDAATPAAGRIHVSVECCPSASPEFEGRGAEELNVQLARFTESILRASSALNLPALCLIPGRQCWALYVDVMVLDSGGNLFDAISIAARAALATTTIPQVNVVEKPGGQFELELSDDPEDMIRIDASNVPVCVTFSQIGAFEVIDASLEEEGCLSCRTTFAVSKDGTFSSSQKGFGAADVKALREQVKIARRIAQQVIEKMDAALEADNQTGTSRIGFFM